MTQDIVEFKLTTPIKIQAQEDGKNIFKDIKTLYMQAPSQKQMRRTINLKQNFLQSIFGMAKSFSQEEANKNLNTEESDKQFDAKGILAAINLGSDNIEKFYNDFEKYLISGVVFLDDSLEQKITSSYIEAMELEDFELMVAKYIEVFFIQSWMKTMS
jgi:hypothetical protein